MADFRRGIIAGVAAAVIFFIISVILNVTGLADRASFFVAAAGLGLWPHSAESWHMVLQIQPRLVQGVIFGAIFAALYAFLPGRTAVRKAIVVSLMIWAIGVIRGMYTSLNWPWQICFMFPGVASSGTAVSAYILGWALISVASAVALGALAGAIWNRLKEREVTAARPGSAVLLVGFAIGIWVWFGAAVTVISWVRMGWLWEDVLSTTPLMWMGSILYPSAACLGLAGWILVLFGWRRTRKGETGFRRGLVGGVLMAVTGIMLLPGVVSIIGAVLSRRKPSRQLSAAETR